MAKNQFQMHILWFFFHADIKMTRKRPWNPYKYKTFSFKNVLFFDHRVRNVPQVSSETSLPWLVQNKPSAPIRRVETRLNSSKDNFIAKSFRLSTKRKLSILLNFLFPFVSFIGVFSILKCKTLVLKTTTWWKRVSHSVDRWHLLGCQIRFFPRPPNGWHDHWTFVGFTDLVWEFFPKLLCN